MVRRKIVLSTKVDVLVKNNSTSTDMSTYKLEFDDSSAEIKGNFLLIHTREKDTLNVVTKLFNLNEVSSFKEYRELQSV